MSADISTEKIRFQCNICDARNDLPRSQFGREIPTCADCGSTVRRRALMRMLAREIFGMDLRLSDFPVLKGIRGLGMSDSLDYAKRLAEKFDYRNTHYDHEPKFDITKLDEHELGSYDFIVSSEVLEHVVAPVEKAFAHLHQLLKPNGVLLLTVPYRPDGETEEHFGPMSDYGFAQVGSRTVLVRKPTDGDYEVFDNLVFHGGRGATLEMRVFSEGALKQLLRAAGFKSIQVHSDDCLAFGVVQQKPWSLPLAARNDPFTLSLDSIRMWTEQWLAYRNRLGETQTNLSKLRNELKNMEQRVMEKVSELSAFRAEITAFKTAWWYKLGRKLHRMP
jgi:SAM-dependent methyltransferase